MGDRFQFSLGGMLTIVALAGLGARMDWPFTASWLTILGVVFVVKILIADPKRHSACAVESTDDEPHSV